MTTKLEITKMRLLTAVFLPVVRNIVAEGRRDPSKIIDRMNDEAVTELLKIAREPLEALGDLPVDLWRAYAEMMNAAIEIVAIAYQHKSEQLAELQAQYPVEGT